MKALFLFVLMVVLISCVPDAGDRGYIDWVRDYKNGMHVRHIQNNLAFDLQYQPSEYVWVQRNGQFDEEAFKADRYELDRMQYFLLNISSRDGGNDVIKDLAHDNVELNNELLYYFSYKFQDDIFLETEAEQKLCSIFHYEQHGTKTFVLGFEKIHGDVKESILTINSSALDKKPVKIKIFTAPKVL